MLKYFLSAMSRTKGFKLDGCILHVLVWGQKKRRGQRIGALFPEGRLKIKLTCQFVS